MIFTSKHRQRLIDLECEMRLLQSNVVRLNCEAGRHEWITAGGNTPRPHHFALQALLDYSGGKSMNTAVVCALDQSEAMLLTFLIMPLVGFCITGCMALVIMHSGLQA
ncbi:hypothetical protein J8F10_03565 [Gemmata sp. G18]|uniref:Uncharacterized protein n=1 Tax=Gemmata palustris TaxID=2822762 RepID=A0ABS5BL03_9BACT|nr:hypothetical protein [Gemmata palustris]MBP3954374.1 hypothetical protein [Gemmata palustris]